MNKIEVTPIFVSSIYCCDLNDIDVNKIKLHIKKIEKETNTKSVSNVGGFQSSPIINEFDNDEVEKLFKENIFSIVNYITNNIWKRKIEFDSFGYWYNINYKNNYNHPHSHVNCILSGVFYIDVDDNSGDIVFTRNDSEYSMLGFAALKDKKTDTFSPDFSLNYSVKPKNGKLIIFPSHLKHRVEQNLSNRERISLSFDIL